MADAKHILVCPLDWGLGHATRMMPVINQLLALGHRVSIASSGRALTLLRQEYAQLSFFELPAYNASYRGGVAMVLDMAIQTPRLLNTIKKEHVAVNQLIDKHRFDAIISDNRYGCHSNKIPCVFVTHQVNILMPYYAKFMQPIVKRINYRFINSFNELWIPDFEGEDNISGYLSHGSLPHLTVKYLGPLSRLQKVAADKKYDVIAILSGPEPMRSHFENRLLKQLSYLDYNCLLVQGKPEVNERRKQGNVSIVSSLNSAALETAIAASGVVIARSGYSTIMDLVKLKKKALLVPTPGQTEQAYLATRLKDMAWFDSVKQEQMDISTDLDNINAFMPVEVPVNGYLKENIVRWIGDCL